MKIGINGERLAIESVQQQQILETYELDWGDVEKTTHTHAHTHMHNKCATYTMYELES